MYPWGFQSSYRLKAPGREGRVALVESVSSPHAQGIGLQVPQAPPLPAGGHWPLCAQSNPGCSLLPGRPVVMVSIHDYGMVYLYSPRPDPLTVPLVPGIPSNMKLLGELHEVALS